MNLRCTWALLVLCAGPAAAQPYSQSMAECAAFFSSWRSSIQREENLENLEIAENRWLSAAYAQAQAEGVEKPQAYTADIFVAKRDEWIEKGGMAALTQDFKDWAAYCRSFGRDRGIDYDFD
ncbi:hypothetical protein [Yoonia sediminilitoris]|uniref:Uncharacterized protein n=1 Tax=Yoonia sediminilitoris TaxID=1286148 RepID=A0A2T6KRL7_9RHOB|nr:hypothetical protein [Yoonia sediminilitoris]PUB19199.1 hypothetical protein C8N45_101792 [Yoonia sediminilitoris]RCW99367.1 hypothetical protein DFP92_101792 [Yoonia sediminilitoris]